MQVTEYGIEKGPRRGKSAAHSTVHSTAARSTAQIIKAAKALSIVSLLLCGQRNTDDPWTLRALRLGAHIKGAYPEHAFQGQATRAVGRTMPAGRRAASQPLYPGQAFENRLVD